MQVARLAALERLVQLAGRLGLEGLEVAYAVAAQAPVQSRARDIRAEKFTRDGQQIIQGQSQGAPQVYHYHFLRWCESGLQALRGVGAVGEDVTSFSLVDRLLGDALALLASTPAA